MAERIGGDLVAESLRALGADTVHGLPGQHALGLFEGLRRNEMRTLTYRMEHNAGFAADGMARVRLRRDDPVPVTPVAVSTGPGALLALPALQEAFAASVPLLVVASQIPSDGLGGARRGYLHELADQRAIAAGVVKSARTVHRAEQIPAVLRQAWQDAASPPYGPTWVEIPQDVLLAPANLGTVRELPIRPAAPEPGPLDEVTRLLDGARNPVILAGGGVARACAEPELRALAERLRAPVVSTFGGKGVFPARHPLSCGSWLEDRHTTDFLATADVLLVAGSGLGELSSNYHSLRPQGTVVQIEADAGKLAANLPVLPVHADAREALAGLAAAVTGRAPDGRAEGAVTALLAAVRERLDSQGLEAERALLDAVREGTGDHVPSFWDMTILAYWAWSAWPGRMHSAQGTGGLGYAFPAALGAAAATGSPVLAVSGDGGAMYGIAELATAAQHQLDVTWLIVDDGGYGILREYLDGAFGREAAHGPAVDLARPDFLALARSFSVRATRTGPDRLSTDLAAELATPGPGVLLLSARPRLFAPS
ncbi:thiamine pyrophosphate-binding protein [Sciscionella sediminilitoris]|uniref:thiamine pyrophosphate-binding protein n=1 Tax=Sciscionella sediminilitoris TaxID=1445613 RepID=UPI0004DF1520|nr:thiamine pyrophosphate-binding protein [Sciscionella sp. SE31]